MKDFIICRLFCNMELFLDGVQKILDGVHTPVHTSGKSGYDIAPTQFGFNMIVTSVAILAKLWKSQWFARSMGEGAFWGHG